MTAAGIIVFETDNNVVIDHNDLRRNQTGIDVETASGNTVSNNRIVGDLAAPVVLTGFGDGIYMGADTSANRIVGNYLRKNVEHDCHDDSVGTNNPPALVANSWRDDDGVTQNKPGLCRAQSGGGHGDDD